MREVYTNRLKIATLYNGSCKWSEFFSLLPKYIVKIYTAIKHKNYDKKNTELLNKWEHTLNRAKNNIIFEATKTGCPGFTAIELRQRGCNASTKGTYKKAYMILLLVRQNSLIQW
jgi:hypothetical protein